MTLTKWLASGLMLVLLSSVQAQEFPVTGAGASGRPGGGHVYVELDYNYGSSFSVVAEDFQFGYEFSGITFVYDASTVGALGAAPQTLAQYVNATHQFATANQGSLFENLNPGGLAAGYKGYSMSFQVPAVAHERSGVVHLSLAFDILSTALPGQSFDVAFAGQNITNVIANSAGDEFTYPGAVQHLSVTVVPEPETAVLMIVGLALLGVYAYRRAKRTA